MNGRARTPGSRFRRSRLDDERTAPLSHEAFPEAMLDLMRWRGLSYRQLAYLTGLSAGHLNHLTRGRRAPTEETLETVARALHVEPEYFAEYRRSLVIDELETRPDVVDLVYGYLTSDATDESEVLGRPTRPATDLV